VQDDEAPGRKVVIALPHLGGDSDGVRREPVGCGGLLENDLGTQGSRAKAGERVPEGLRRLFAATGRMAGWLAGPLVTAPNGHLPTVGLGRDPGRAATPSPPRRPRASRAGSPLESTRVSAVLALLSSLLWGVADFLGGTVSRRIATFAVIGISQAIALACGLVAAAVLGSYDDPIGYLPWALGAGAVGFVGVAAFYRALATGTMGVVAPIAATGTIVPVAAGLARGESPSALQLVGAVVTIVGVVLASGPDLRGTSGSRQARPIALAFVAAAGFGFALLFIANGSDKSVVMTLVMMRVIDVGVVGVLALVVRHVGGFRRTDLPALAALGGSDIIANALYGVATTSGLVSLTAVLASLYPAVTVLLARRIHGERMRRVQDVGVVTTLLGVVLLAAGGGVG
jgi:drug/metabolite transporter (DMT)-like permease